MQKPGLGEWGFNSTLNLYIEKTGNIEREFEFLYEMNFMQVCKKWYQLLPRCATAPKTCTDTTSQSQKLAYTAPKPVPARLVSLKISCDN